MKVGIVLAGMAGLLCAPHGRGTGEAGLLPREAYLRRLGSCSEEELRKRLEFRIEKKDVLGAREIVQSEGVYGRVKDGRLGGFFAMVGMMLTDGIWHSRYAEAFERSKLDAGRDEGLIKKLINEMATGELWASLNEMQAEAAAKRLEEECNNDGKTRAPEEGLSDVVHHIAWEIERRLPPVDRRWGRVLETLLKNGGVVVGLVEGRYNKEVSEMIGAQEELEHVLFGYVLRRKSVLNDMADKSPMLASKLVVRAIEKEYWLYIGVLERAMATERMKKLFSEDDAFKKMRERYGAEGEELSAGRLKELALEEGRLDELVSGVLMRLVRYGEVDELKKLVETAEGSVFDILVRNGRLDGALKEGMVNIIRHGWMDDLEWLVKTVEGRVFDGLLGGEELDAALKEGIENMIRNGWADGLRTLMATFGTRVLDGLLDGEELDAALREGIEKLVRRRWIDGLRTLMEIGAVKRRVSSGLLSPGELDAVFKKMVESITRDGSRGQDELDTLKEAVRERLFDGLVSMEELDKLSGKSVLQRAKRLCAIV